MDVNLAQVFQHSRTCSSPYSCRVHPFGSPTPSVQGKQGPAQTRCRVRTHATGGVEASKQSPFERAVNVVTEIVTKSPLNEGKKRFFQRLAGEYDRSATQDKIQQVIQEHKVRTASRLRDLYAGPRLRALTGDYLVSLSLKRLVGSTICFSNLGSNVVEGCNEVLPRPTG